MGLVLGEDAVRRDRAAVRAEHCQWVRHEVAYVSLVTVVHDTADLVLLFLDEPQEDLGRLAVPLGRDPLDGLADSVAVLVVLHIAHDHLVPLPGQALEPACRNLLAGALASRGVRQALHHLLRAALLKPLGRHLRQVGAAGKVRVHVVGHIHALCAGLLDGGSHRVAMAILAAVDDSHVGVLDRHAGPTPNLDCLLDRLHMHPCPQARV